MKVREGALKMMAELEVSITDAALMFNVADTTLRRAARMEVLRARRVAGVWLVRPSAVRRWLEGSSKRRGPTAGKKRSADKTLDLSCRL